MKAPLAYDLYIFDMGNVVIKDITTLESIAAHYGFDLDQLRFDYDHYAFPMMDGTIDSALYWSHVEHQFGISVEGDPLADFFHPRWNDPVVAILEQLRKRGKRVVCGSNTYAPHWELLHKRNFFSVFDAVYASHELGFSKPAVPFFTAILEMERTDPSRTLFVDDYEENVEAARSLGMDAVLYSFDDVLPTFFAPLSASI